MFSRAKPKAKLLLGTGVLLSLIVVVDRLVEGEVNIGGNIRGNPSSNFSGSTPTQVRLRKDVEDANPEEKGIKPFSEVARS